MWLVKRWIEAYESPRASARRLLAARLSGGQAVSMAIAGFALHMALARLSAMLLGTSGAEVTLEMMKIEPDQIERQLEAARSWAGLIEAFLVDMASFVGVAALAWAIGRRFGGSGGFDGLLALSGWHALVAAPASVVAEVLLVLSAPGLFGIGFVVQLAAAIYLFYVLSAFIAEAHAFPSTGQVMAVSLGVAFVVTVVLLYFSVLMSPQAAAATALW